MPKPADENDLKKELREQDRLQAIRAHERFYRLSDRNDDATVASGTLALRSLMLINGGAAVALLAFVGTLATNDAKNSFDLLVITGPLMWFVWGVALSVLAIGLVYCTNYCMSCRDVNVKLTWKHPFIKKNDNYRYWHVAVVVFQIFTYLSGVGSLVCFIYGMYDIRMAIQIMTEACTVSVPWALIFECWKL